ncbi:hypothetical protein KKC60_00715 [Patescibacteria group bacterium]|nr:hypothetical protein [Patescibacteria group bacterium]
MEHQTSRKLVFLLLATISLSLLWPQNIKADSSSDLSKLQDEIRDYQDKIEELNNQEESLTKEIALLENEITKSGLEIDKTELKLEKLEGEIDKTTTKIRQTEKEVQAQKKTLRDYIRLLNEYDDVSLVETVFSTKTLADFFDQVYYSNTLQQKTKEALKAYQNLQDILVEKKTRLNNQQEETTVLLTQLEAQNKELQRMQGQKESLLEKTRGEEDKFQELYKEAQGERQKLLASLVTSDGNGGKISLGEAELYAVKAQEKTGVRKSVLMAIIEQETYFGANTGSGYYKDDMKPKLHPIFEEVCRDLGLDPETTPVSKKPTSYQGWGGAMGYAQIMPYEWRKIRAEAGRLTGHDLPSPWNPEDAFMGAAILLRDRGGADPERETEAIGRYFAGGYWQKYSWYAESVLRKAEKYE